MLLSEKTRNLITEPVMVFIKEGLQEDRTCVVLFIQALRSNKLWAGRSECVWFLQAEHVKICESCFLVRHRCEQTVIHYNYESILFKIIHCAFNEHEVYSVIPSERVDFGTPTVKILEKAKTSYL